MKILEEELLARERTAMTIKETCGEHPIQQPLCLVGMTHVVTHPSLAAIDASESCQDVSLIEDRRQALGVSYA